MSLQPRSRVRVPGSTDNGAAAVGKHGLSRIADRPGLRRSFCQRRSTADKGTGIPKIGVEGVLLAGGRDASGRVLSSAEIWDPATHKTSSTYPMHTARELHTATLLQNGAVLIAGGHQDGNYGVGKAELFDPETGSFSVISSLILPRFSHSATLFTNGALAGKVLIVGGCCDNSGNALKSAELYDPATQQFTPTGSMATARMDATATLLDDGDVLISGGAEHHTIITVLRKLNSTIADSDLHPDRRYATGAAQPLCRAHDKRAGLGLRRI